jgi:hypothetical protein
MEAEELLSYGQHESENSIHQATAEAQTMRQQATHSESREDPELYSYRVGGELFILDKDRQLFLECETIYHRFE